MEVSSLSVGEGSGSLTDDRTHELSRSTSVPGVRYGKGDSLGRYVILGVLGSGGMAVVYSAYDPELDRKVALKVIRDPEFDSNSATFADSKARQLREAQALAKLSHRNVVQVFDVGPADGGVFITMEHIDGGTLGQWLAKERRPWRQVLTLFLDAGRGLAAAHAAGFVHRDFKPQNVLIGADGSARVMDFGIARRDSDLAHDPVDVETEKIAQRVAEELTTQGVVMGTPTYMPPEQHRGADVDARADQYSFCAALYQGVYGVRPFVSNTRAELLRAKQERDLIPPSPDRERGVPRWLHRTILRGLEPDPEKRWPSMAELLRVLERDRKGGERLAAGFVVAGLLGGGGFAYANYANARAQVCAGAEQQMTDIWNDTVKQTIEDAFRGSGKPYAFQTWSRVEPALDRYAQGWASMHTEACEATQVRKDQSMAIMDLRMTCLDERKWNLRALIQVLSQADGRVVENAVTAVGKLGSIEACADLEALQVGQPVPEADQDAVAALREALAEPRARQIAGLFREGLELVAPMVDEAREIGYSPLLAQALLIKGGLHYDVGECEEAEKYLVEASWRADSGRDLPTSVRAKNSLEVVVGWCLHRNEEGRVWSQATQGLIQQLGDPEVEAHHLNAQAIVAMGRGQYDEAEEYIHDAIKLQRQVTGEEDVKMANFYRNLGIIAVGRGSIDDGLRYTDKTISLQDRLLGEGHSEIGFTLLVRTNLRMLNGQYDLAEQDGRRAVELFETNMGKDSHYLSTVFRSLGQVLLHKGDFAQSRAMLERALEIDLEHDPKGVGEVRSLSFLGRYYEAVGDLPQALDYDRRAESLARTIGLERMNGVQILGNLGRILVALERFQEALPILEETLPHVSEIHRANGDVALTRFALARALSATGGDPERVATLAREALRLLQKDVREPFYDPFETEIRSWLATRLDASSPP